jgi:hypothetical protein
MSPLGNEPPWQEIHRHWDPTARKRIRRTMKEMLSMIRVPTSGGAVPRAVSYRLPTVTARVRARVNVLWELWTRWHWGRLPRNSCMSRTKPSNHWSTVSSIIIQTCAPGQLLASVMAASFPLQPKQTKSVALSPQIKYTD